MALYELDEFQGPQFLGFVRAVPTPQSFLGSLWLPDVTTFDLSFEYILGSNEQPVMAHVMGWDSEAPIHGRPGLGERVQGELPPIKRKARISEKEIIRFLTPRAGVPDVQEAINSVYNLTATLLDSVQARVEWLRMQALSEDTVVYNEGGVIFNFDFGITPEYQINLETQEDGAGTNVSADYSTEWNDVANANPVMDLQMLCDTIEDNEGVRPVRFVCSRKALGYLLNNVNIRNLIRGSSAPAAVLTRAELDTVFQLYNLPDITTYDVKVRSENADGTYTDVRTMAENKAFLVPGGGSVAPGHSSIGATLWGPTAESRPLIGSNMATQAPGVYAVVYGQEEPPSEWSKAVGVSFPSMPGANKLGQMKLWADAP